MSLKKMFKSWKAPAIGGVAALMALVPAATGATRATRATCDNSNPVKVGGLYSLTGPVAEEGKLYSQGAQIAVKDINNSGGVLGRCVVADILDDQASPTTAAQAVRQLVQQDNVAWVEGSFLSALDAVELPVTTQAKKIQIIGGATNGLVDPNTAPYGFRTEVTVNEIGQSYIPYLKAHKYTKVALIYDNNATGNGVNSLLQTLLPQNGMSLTGSVAVGTSTPDLTAQLQQLKAGNPEVLVTIVSSDVNQTAAIRGRNSLGWNVPIIGEITMLNKTTTNAFRAADMKDVLAADTYRSLTYKTDATGKRAPTSPVAKHFVAAFLALNHSRALKEAVANASAGYDSWMLVANAANKTKSLDADTIKQYLESHWTLGSRGLYVFSPQSHDGVPLNDVVMSYAKNISAYGTSQQAP
jgi:branched-chain amino acid transport system substrate-binding protein